MTHEAATTVRELPEPLPQGESILWQGRPEWTALYRRALHARSLAIYFLVLLAARGATALAFGSTPAQALVAVLWLVPAALFALGVLALIAKLSARASWYTITDRRVVMRIGIVLEITFNFPFKVIDNVSLHVYDDGTGDIALRFMEGEQIAWLHLWPHARPWRLRQTEPMLRCVPDAARVASLLARTIASTTGGTALPIPASVEPANASLDSIPPTTAASAA